MEEKPTIYGIERIRTPKYYLGVALTFLGITAALAYILIKVML